MVIAMPLKNLRLLAGMKACGHDVLWAISAAAL